MTAEELIRRLEGTPLERLRWRVLHDFRILPGSRAARGLNDEDVLICGAHMVLDARRRRAGEKSGVEFSQNEGFDSERFSELGGEI